MIKWFAFCILTSHCFIQSKYLILAPWAVQSIYSFLFKEESKRDLSNFFILPLLLWRMLHNQIWISISRYQNAKGNNLVVDRSLQFEQVDREQSWLVLILFLYTQKLFFFFFFWKKRIGSNLNCHLPPKRNHNNTLSSGLGLWEQRIWMSHNCPPSLIENTHKLYLHAFDFIKYLFKYVAPYKLLICKVQVQHIWTNWQNLTHIKIK